MIMNKRGDILDYKNLFMLLLVCVTNNVGFSKSMTNMSKADAEVVNPAAFQKALEVSDDSHAISIGNSIFSQLETKYRNDTGFDALKSKLVTSEFLAKQMISQLSELTDKRIEAATDELIYKKKKNDKTNWLTLAPAKSFYDRSVKLFSNPIRIDNLTGEEKVFLTQYYDLKLRILISTLAQAGQALTIAEPTFKGTHDYVLVLPLLHVSDKKMVDISILPRWMQRPEQLDVFSDSCLLHFGLPFHALMLAKKSAQIQEKSFSELQFYRIAAKKCGRSHPHVAVDCLQRAIDYVPKQDSDLIVTLQFEIVKLWLNSGNYTLAAGQAHKIFETYPNHKESGQALWLYYSALLKSDNADRILAHIDNALDDKRCEAHKAKLMYIKWWALRRKGDETGRIAALEYELLKQYGNDPVVVSILLSRTADHLARENYRGAHESLTQLIEKFPSTKGAVVAKRMLAELEAARPAK